MNIKQHPPIEVTKNFYKLGTPAFPCFLSIGDFGMLIEGGTGPTYQIIVDQINYLGIDPKTIKYIVLTHTHADHIGGIPHFKRIWPHIKLIASPNAEKVFSKTELFHEFLVVDTGIAQLMKAKNEIEELPPVPEDYTFQVDQTVKEGDKLDLGKGIVWDVYETTGHSHCHLSFFDKKEGTLIVGDSTGFYVPEKDAFWPNYFVSLPDYCNSIRKLATLPAKRAVLSHNHIIEGDVKGHLKSAMDATREYHNELLDRLERGDDPESIAIDKGRFVYSITDIQPFKVMYDLCKVMVMRSQKNGRDSDFSI
ncbi:MAG: MBL fold metallo-hydrolase [Deltaproteobacteria bacterium]|nr:MBL fold metallo-hydrolase [Deltaproteobacteria bacterium]